MEGSVEKRSFQMSHKLILAVTLCLLTNILLICAVSYGWVQISKLSQRVDKISLENSELRLLIQSSHNKNVSPITRREVISPITMHDPKPDLSALLVVQLQDKVATIQTEITNLGNRIKKYHSDITGIVCPSNYRLNPHTGTCVRLVRSSVTWFDAKLHCEQAGEHLATFDSMESVTWLTHQQLTGGWNVNAPWLGGRKFNGEWRWYGLLTGPISLSYWRAPQPDGDGNCLHLSDRSWNDLSCNRKMFYFCEKIPQL